MRNQWAIAFLCLLATNAARPAFSQPVPETTVVIDPITPGYASGNVRLKSARMVDSDRWAVNVHLHQSQRAPLPGLGWAGIRATIHNLDPNEVDVDAIYSIHGPFEFNMILRTLADEFIPIPLTPPYNSLQEPLGPRSNNVGSVARAITFFITNESGIDLVDSHIRQLFGILLHAKNTNAGQNSTFNDVSIKLSDIWHFRQPLFGGSTTFELPASYNLYVASNIANSQVLHMDGIGAQTLPYASKYRLPPSKPIGEADGHWLHLQQTRVFHRFANSGTSVYLANPMMVTFSLGIEHVPEPTALLLLAGGASCLTMGLRARRKRGVA